MPGPSKYWFRGLPLPGADQAETTGELKYWWRGLPSPVLNSYIPPLPPSSTDNLPRALRLARQVEEDWIAPNSRRFAPPEITATPATALPFKKPKPWVWTEADWTPLEHASVHGLGRRPPDGPPGLTGDAVVSTNIKEVLFDEAGFDVRVSSAVKEFLFQNGDVGEARVSLLVKEVLRPGPQGRGLMIMSAF